MNRCVAFPRFTLLGPCLAVASVLTLPPHIFAQKGLDDYSKGTQFFRLVLQSQAGKPEFFEKLTVRDDPHDCLVIILGNPSGLEKIPNGLNTFVQNGGAVLFATDQSHSDFRLGIYGIEMSGDVITCEDSAKTYRGSKWCPTVNPTVAGRVYFFKDTPDTPFPGALATNVTSYLTLYRHFPGLTKLSVLANLPEGVLLNAPNRAAKVPREPLPFAVGGLIDDEGGRLLVLADHSVFINLMMQQTDNGNFEFAKRVAAWLSESDLGKRKRILFLEDDVPQGSVSVKELQSLPIPPEIPKPSLNSLIPVANALIAGLQKEDRPNQLLADLLPSRRLFRWLPIVLTTLIVCYGFMRSRRQKHCVEVAAPLLTTAIKRARPDATAIEMRHESLMRGGNLWEPARLIARQFFEKALGARLEAPGVGGGRMPGFEIEGGGLRGWIMSQRLRRLWRFAHYPLPQPITMKQFRKFAAKVADLTDAVAQGRIRFFTTFQPTGAR